MRPAEAPVDPCVLPLLELPPVAELDMLSTTDSMDSFLDDASTEVGFIGLSVQKSMSDLSESSDSAGSGSAWSGFFLDRQVSEESCESLAVPRAPASPPLAPRLRPASAPAIDIFLMPDLELPPAAEDSPMGSSDEEPAEDEVEFVLDGFDDNGLETCHSEQGSVSPNFLWLQSEKKLEALGQMAKCDAKDISNMPPLLFRASSSCSTREPTPRKEHVSRPVLEMLLA